MPLYLRPGVYIEEVPGPKPIEGVATNIGAFVGVAERGPFNVPTLVTGWNQYVEQFGSFLWNRYLAYAVYSFFDQGGQVCYIVRATGDQVIVETPLPGTDGAEVNVRPTSGGLWPTLLQLSITNYPATVPADTKTDLFTLGVYYETDAPITPNTDSVGTTSAEVFLRQYLLQNQIQPVVALEDGAITGYRYFVETYPGLSIRVPDVTDPVELQAAVQRQWDAQINGTSAFIRIRISDVDTATPGRPDNTNGEGIPLQGTAAEENFVFADKTRGMGIYALETVEDASLLVLPDLVGAVTQGGQLDYAAIRNTTQEALTYCERRHDLFMIVDPPPRLSVAEVRAFKEATTPFTGQALNSAFGALYYPWLYILDPISKRQLILPPSGALAGIYARTDQRIGVYKAPAGTQDGRVNQAVGLQTTVTDADQDVLNPLGINAIRNLYQIGIVVWGARTLTADPEWKYINVRRLVTYVEESLETASQVYVFEPNAMGLWALINRDFTDFLTGLWREGALFGNTASQAFFVVVDESNNPPQTRDKGELYIDVGIAPVKPAEFIIIRIRQTIPEPA